MNGRKVWVAGHKVGSAVTRYLEARGDAVIRADRSVVDLRNQIAVEVWLKQNRPDTIIFAAAKIGGIYANEAFPAEFIYDNLAIAANVIHSAHLANVDRLVFLGSSFVRTEAKLIRRPRPVRIHVEEGRKTSCSSQVDRF
jgi:GDP-L-fucose synthase